MSRVLKKITASGVTTSEIQDYEIRHRKVARLAASSGIVLLKNSNSLLPIDIKTPVALYGSGATHYIKGGTGSGDVNEREIVSIREGMKAAGYTIANSAWLDEYEEIYNQARLEWRDLILAKTKAPDSTGLFDIHARTPMKRPIGSIPTSASADIAIYVLSRIAGEGADRLNAADDYKLSDDEYAFVKELSQLYKNVVLVVNAGGLVDLSFVDDFDNIDAIIQLVQPGMEGGNAFADIISGKVTPSGKLTDSWAYNYEDYPCADEFSTYGPTLDYSKYKEGIYVGYRYFDSFNKGVRYGFGFGLSYTSFAIETLDVQVVNKRTSNPVVQVRVKVTNIGDKYSGREVVQVYVSCPDGKLEKEYRRLVAYAKTDELVPSESQEILISFPMYSCASYDVDIPGYILEDGYYGIWVGSSLGESKIRGLIRLAEDAIMVRTEHVCPIQVDDLTEFSVASSKRETRYHAWVDKAKGKGLPIIKLTAEDIKSQTIEYGKSLDKIPAEAMEFVDSLSKDQMITLATGDPVKSQDAGLVLGSAGLSIPGSAAETSNSLYDRGLGSMVLSDGPAGLRLDKKYYIDKDGMIHQRQFMEKVEDGLFMEREEEVRDDYTTYYQYCTAFPVGTLLAQTWDTNMIEKVGEAVAEEMIIFRTALWLAPGMNIHRNPLCGRNFEYYSEDPVVSGTIAAAMTRGVQRVGGCGTTIKHFACNNEEENRMHNDSILSERTLREIYLKGFEICVKSVQPMAIMTSYNLINGIHTANNYDLCTKIARDEWNYAGMFMTDWTTTEHGDDCTASGCMRAGNDLVCPGNVSDQTNLNKELDEGTLTIDDIKPCVARLVNTIWQSNAYENAVDYTEQFDDLQEFVSVHKEMKQ